jgi:hypothetical protein
VAFPKPFLAIPNLAHSCFSLSLQNPNKQNAPLKKGVLCTFLCASHSVQSKALSLRQQGIFKYNNLFLLFMCDSQLNY